MATLNDVARRAAVTAATVSNVITGKGSVSQPTRARVLAAIEELGYHPNLVARGLARGRSCLLALLLPNIANPFYPEIALEVQRVATERGYHLLLYNNHEDQELGRAHLESLSGGWVDGMIALWSGVGLPYVLAAPQHGLPVVLCCWEEEPPEDIAVLPSVTVDFNYGGELAAQHLVELGHRQVAVIVLGNAIHHTHRLEGFQSELNRLGIPLPQEYVRYGDSTLESGYHAGRALLQLAQRPTGIFVSNDLMALGVMEAAIDLGLRVPSDLSLIGFDDILLAAHVRPTLTTVAIPKRDVAREATDLLLHHIDGVDQQPHHIVVRPFLVVRHSTAAAPAIPAAPLLSVL